MSLQVFIVLVSFIINFTIAGDPKYVDCIIECQKPIQGCFEDCRLRDEDHPSNSECFKKCVKTVDPCRKQCDDSNVLMWFVGGFS